MQLNEYSRPQIYLAIILISQMLTHFHRWLIEQMSGRASHFVGCPVCCSTVMWHLQRFGKPFGIASMTFRYNMMLNSTKLDYYYYFRTELIQPILNEFDLKITTPESFIDIVTLIITRRTGWGIRESCRLGFLVQNDGEDGLGNAARVFDRMTLREQLTMALLFVYAE